MRSLSLILLLASCSETTLPNEIGITAACLTMQGVPEPTHDTDDHVVYVIEGTVTSTERPDSFFGGTVAPCFAEDGQFLTIEDGDGVRWHVGWYADEGGTPRVLDVDVGIDDEVIVALVREKGFAGDVALAIRDGEGLLLAVEEGYDSTLAGWDPELVDGLEVSRTAGGANRIYKDECGTRVTEALAFDGDGDPVTLDVWSRGTVDVGGVTLQARNVGAWSYLDDEVDCTDTWGPAPWIAWREPVAAE